MFITDVHQANKWPMMIYFQANRTARTQVATLFLLKTIFYKKKTTENISSSNFYNTLVGYQTHCI